MAKRDRPIKTPTRGLTDKFLQNLRCPAGYPSYDVPDKTSPSGMYARVVPSGRITFRWNPGNASPKTYGVYGKGADQLSLKQARDLHHTAKARRQHGDVLAGDRPETVGEMLELFYAGDIAENRRRPEVVRDAFDRDLLPLLGKRKLDPPVPASVIADAIRAIVKRPAATYAGRCFQILNQAFDWAQANAYIDYNPCQPLRAARLGVVNGKRDRTPDAAELREILLAIDAAQRMSLTIKLALKVVMHTLVRVGELCAAQWSDVDLERGLWRIPATNSKSARNWVVPLTPSVVEMFRTLQVLAEGSPWVLASKASADGHLGRKSVWQGLSRLFKATGRDGAPLLDIEPCAVHDFRRAGRTGLKDLRMIDPISRQRVRIPYDVLERCLNHSLSGLAAVYDTGDLLDERRAALTSWSEHLDALATGGDNIVVLGGAA